MKRLRLIAIVTVLALIFSTASAFACTGMYVGKDVSAEGTTVIARSEDQGSGSYNKMFYVIPAEKKAGRYFVDEGEDQNGFKVALPEETYKYTTLADATDAGDGMYPASCMNEYGLAVIGTISAGVKEAFEEADPYQETGTGLREAIIPGLVCCQAKTAREAVEVLGALTDEYGSEEGNILLFADKNEAWIFESYGGHTYAAMRLPSDKVAVFGNQFMIGVVDQNDTENYFFSKNLFSTIDKAGAVKEGGKYNLVKSIEGTREEYSNMRNWIGVKTLAPSRVKGFNNNFFYGLCYPPDFKVSVLDLMKLYGNRYEGTPQDMEKNPGNRPIGVTRQSDIHIIQIFDQLPDDSCALQWLAMGNAEHAIFVPAFSGITDTFDAYKVDKNEYNEASMYYACKRLCGLAESDRAFLSQGVKDFNLLQEKIMLDDVMARLPEVQKAYASGTATGRAYVTNMAKEYAKTQFENTTPLYNSLMVTFLDNINDRTNNQRKHTFVADVKVADVAKYLGGSASGSKTVSFTAGGSTYTFSEGSDVCTKRTGNKTTEVELSKAAFMQNGALYIPMDFVAGL